jgi:hypothetical protein
MKNENPKKKKLSLAGLGLLALLFIFLSCKPETAPVTWEPIDYVGTVDAMANPTGELLNDDPEQTVAMLAGEIGLSVDEFDRFIMDLTQIQKQLMPIFDNLEGSQGGFPEDDIADAGLHEEKATGTSAYVQINCSGPDGTTRPGDFNDPEYGFIRFDDPDISVDEIVSNGYVPNGDLLSHFSDCQDNDLAIKGHSAGFASDYYDNLLLDLIISLTDDSDFSYSLENFALFSSSLIVVLFEVGTDRTYSITVELSEGLTFVLGTVDGYYFCTFGDDPPLQCGVQGAPLSE